MDPARAHLRNVGPTPPAPSLHENALAVRSLTPEIAVRSQAYLFASAGVVGLLGVILPHPGSFNTTGMISVQVGSLVAAVILYLVRYRVPGWLATSGPFCATVLTSAVLLFSGASTSAYLLFYLWVTFYAFYFLSRREAALLASFAIVNYAAVVLAFRIWGEPYSGPQGNEDVPAVVLVTGTVAVAGVFIVLLRERVGRLIRELTEAVTTVLNLAEALDVRDNGTAQHSQTVGRYSELMACELGLGADRAERLRLAGVLHDIGKIGVPDSILRKPGPLTADEFDQMRQHPEIGSRILGGSGLEDIKRWIYAHHERPDGRGYPRGIVGDEIPLEAKILAVADAYEAMTSDRVYRKAIGADAARDELRSGSGTQFEPAVVDAFLTVLEAQIELRVERAAVQQTHA